MADTPIEFKRPSALSLTRVANRLSFLYLDMCAVQQDENGTLAVVGVGTSRERTAYLPTAQLTCLLLGPGTSVTQQAVAAMSRSACSVAFVGAGSVRSYGAFLSPYAPTRLLERQALVAIDGAERVAAAKTMYAKRFPGPLFEHAPPDVSIEQLRGMEGTRMKAIYRAESRKRRLTGWRRNTGNLGDLDPVNLALNHGNTALYGTVHGVVLALGLSPGLGVIHRGNRHAFVLDIADLYKTEVTIPLAFSLHNSPEAGRDATLALRREFRLLRLLPRIVDDIYDILGVDSGAADDDPAWDVDELLLWAPAGSVPSGPNYGYEP